MKQIWLFENEDIHTRPNLRGRKPKNISTQKATCFAKGSWKITTHHTQLVHTFVLECILFFQGTVSKFLPLHHSAARIHCCWQNSHWNDMILSISWHGCRRYWQIEFCTASCPKQRNGQIIVKNRMEETIDTLMKAECNEHISLSNSDGSKIAFKNIKNIHRYNFHEEVERISILSF